MPRRKVIAKREILPDPKFKSQLLTRFINVLMLHGKKSKAEQIVYGALELAHKKLQNSSDEQSEESGSGTSDSALSAGALKRMIEIMELALDNIRPSVEVRSRRVGGATYQVPVEVRPERSQALAMRWLVQYARNRSEKGMMRRLAGELVEANQNRGSAVKKREDTHRMAEANKAFAHFRW